MSSIPTTAPGVVITVLYTRTPTLTFDLDYYRTSHLPLASGLWEKYGLITAWTQEGATEDSAYKIILTILWKELKGWEEATANKEEMEKIMGDVGNFTNGTPEFVVGKIVG